MGSVYEEITRLETAKTDIETAIEGCGVNVPDTKLISDYASYIRQIPSAVFSGLNVEPIGGDDTYIKIIELTNGLISATTGGLVSSTSSGLVPKITVSTDLIKDQSKDWVLTSTDGAEPQWKKLPVSSFAISSGVVTALGTNGNYVTWTKNGIANNLTVPYASTAALLAKQGGTSTSTSIWNPQTSWTKVWGQSFTDSSISSDTGDILYYLRAGEYSPKNTELCVVIDGDYYAGTGQYKVWHAGNLTKVSQLDNDSGFLTSLPGHSHSYLPLAGGKMDSTAFISWNNGADGNDVSDWNITDNGLRIISSVSTDAKAPTQYSTALHVKGRYGFQLASAGGAASNSFYIKNVHNTVWNSLIHSGNIGSLSVNYATLAGSVVWANVSGKPSFATVATSGSYNDLSNKPSIPTVTDYYWANVKVSASSSTATSPTFQECYVNGWFRSTGNNGWYNPTHGSYIHPNATTAYGNLVVRGAKSGYTGINLGNSTSHMTVMSTESHHGLYCEDDGVWEFYYNKGNKLAGILTSFLQSTSALTVGGGLHVGGTIRVVPTLDFYQEGIRIQPCGSWSVLMLLGTDTTAATSGTSAKSWGFFNNDGTFYINKNNSSGANAARAMATSTGWTFGNTSTNSYALNTASFICDSWVRTSGATGWYNESYGGGWYMTDSTWIRNYNSKQTYLSVSTYPSLVCNAQGGSESNIRFEIAGANKGYTGYMTGYGTFLWNSTASKCVYVSDSGYFYTQSYINVGQGNEKNASNPPYVWGVNGYDNFMRTYATSSLSVNYANSAGSIGGFTISNFMVYGYHPDYVTASFTDENLSKKAAEKYIEYLDGAGGWFNSTWGKVTAHNGFVGNLTGTASYATSASLASKLTIHDVRDAVRNPNYFDGLRVTSWFNSTGTPTTAWHSGIHVKGWTNGYTSWELCSYASTGTDNNYNLYFRSGNNTTWGNWKTIITSGNIGSIWTGTKALYNSATKNNNTIYIIYS